MKTNPTRILATALLGLLLVAAGQAKAQTITWQENWESPSVQDNWYADNGVWEMGVPTSGPSPRADGWRAHQGTNCAATVLGGNYPALRTSRLVSSPILVPVASLNPRLRFWHWWSFTGGDYGKVQVSTNNGVSWVDLSGQYATTSDGRWSRAWLDLKPYAGQTVLLGLYFTSPGGATSYGWYVDEIAIETGPEPGFTLPEGFESGWGGWKADYIGGLATDSAVWEIGVPTSGPPPRPDGWRAHQGTNCAATVLSGIYPAIRTSRLVSPAFEVPVASLSPRLRFWHWWSFTGGDYGKVQISTNNGISWVDLSGQYATTSDGRWSRAWLDLKPYAGQTVLLGLYFTSPGGATSYGWYVDEIAIETGPEPGISLPEGFEGGWGGWKANYIGGLATDSAVWEIGVPTSGPPPRPDGWRAHQGTNCAATVLSGIYPAIRTSRLVSPAFEVPVASLSPRLRFWHWWSFTGGDYGKVQISTNNGISWVDLSGQYATTSDGRWSRAWLDLKPYAGQTVLLGLYFTSPGGATSYGWYVDEIAIETGPEPGFTLPEGFEGGWGAWKADYIGGKATDSAVWEIGKPTSGPGAAHGGTNCAATVLSGIYPAIRTSRLVSPAFEVPVASLSPRLRFWHWWSFTGGDYGKVQISTNNGISWVDLSGQYATTSDGRWSRAWLDLKPYAGQTVLLGLYFTSPGGATSYGWYVDEIAIETGPEPGFTLPEGFESGWGGWKANYIGGLATDSAVWEIGVPTSGPPPRPDGWRAHQGTNCAATVLGGNYPVGRTSRLFSPAFEVPAANLNPRLRFYHWWSFSGGDYGKMQVSTNNGVSWVDLSTNTTSSGGWTYSPPFSLSPYGGQTVLLGLFFTSPGGGASSGWYVDDMVLLADGYKPMITAQPTNVTVLAGDMASFSVALSPVSTTPLSYQWRFKGLPILDATDATYTIPRAQTNHASCCGQGYDVVITNIHGSVTSVPPAELTVLVRPSITLQPQSQTVPVGSDVTFSVAATGTATLSYQWRSNGIAVQGATASSLLLPNVQLSQSGSFFSVVVSNAAGSTNSADAWLTVIPDCDAFVGYDVGDVGAAGSFSRTNCDFTVRGSGEDIEDTADAFQFVHQPLIGDGQIEARVLSIEGADGGSEAGLMMRESLDAGARHVFVALNASKSLAFRRRLAVNDYSAENRYQSTNSGWLRLMRMGNTFVAHYSTNGLNWDYVWFTTLNLPSQLEVGLAVTAHSYGLMSTGRFDNVSLGGLTPLPGVWPEAGPRIFLGGEVGGMTEFQRVGGFKALVGGVVGDRYAIKSSASIDAPVAAWSNVGTVTNTYGVVPFMDAQALTNSIQFYRAAVLSP